MNWRFPLYQIDNQINWDGFESKFEWFRAMKNVPQDPIWHAEEDVEGDVLIHTKMVVEALISLPEFQELSETEKHILFASAMLHDVEKRSTTTTEEIDGKERIVSPRHAKKGEFTDRTMLYKDLPTPFKIREQICKLVRWHGLPLWAIEKSDPRKAVIEASLGMNTKFLALLAKADVLGRICEDQDEILLRIELFKALCQENNCWGQVYHFKSDYGRFLYLNKPDLSPDYEPFDDLKLNVFVLLCQEVEKILTLKSI